MKEPWSSPVVQQAKDLVLPRQWLGSDLWPGDFHMLWEQQKKKKRTRHRIRCGKSIGSNQSRLDQDYRWKQNSKEKIALYYFGTWQR